MTVRKPSFAKRIEAADNPSRQGLSAFEKAAEQLEEAARQHRQVYDDVVTRIDELESVRDQAQNAGISASRNARKIREFFSA